MSRRNRNYESKRHGNIRIGGRQRLQGARVRRRKDSRRGGSFQYLHDGLSGSSYRPVVFRADSDHDGGGNRQLRRQQSRRGIRRHKGRRICSARNKPDPEQLEERDAAPGIFEKRRNPRNKRRGHARHYAQDTRRRRLESLPFHRGNFPGGGRRTRPRVGGARRGRLCARSFLQKALPLFKDRRGAKALYRQRDEPLQFREDKAAVQMRRH